MRNDPGAVERRGRLQKHRGKLVDRENALYESLLRQEEAQRAHRFDADQHVVVRHEAGADQTDPSAPPPVNVNTRSDPWAPGPVDRGRSLAALERVVGEVPLDGQRRLADALSRFEATSFEGTVLDRWLISTSDPAYRSAFAKVVRDVVGGHRSFTDRELLAWQRVEGVQRAMGIGTGAGGGFQVPFQLEPTIMLTSDGSVDPLRRVGRVITAVSDVVNLVSSAGVVAEWLPEAQEAADASPTLAQPTIPIYKGSSFVGFSVEYGMDADGGLEELQRLLVDGADQLQAAAHMTGSGSGQPEGLASGLAAGSLVPTATADVLVAADVVGLQNSLPPRFQPRAQWIANLATINEIAGFETSNGSLRFPETANDRLLRKPLNEGSHLDAAGDTAAAGNDNVLLYGDFQTGFVIADRIGTTVEVVQHLVGAAGRPTGQRGLWMWFRTGSAVVVDEAVRLLTA